MKDRMESIRAAPASIVFGASGYLGTLIAASILADRPRVLVLPIRATTDRDAYLARLRGAVRDRGVADDRLDDRLALVSLVELPPLERMTELAAVIRARGV